MRKRNRGRRSRTQAGSGSGVSRRGLIGGAAALSIRAALAAGRPTPAVTPARARSGRGRSVVVIGAGAFGGWAALSLLRRGATVTLVDAWGPGNSRASSGGETRVIRGVYGSDRIYTEMAATAFRLWHENEARWKKRLYFRTGALWMVTDDGDFVRSSMPILRGAGFGFEELATEDARKRYPQIDFGGVRWALFEKEAGYLLARRSCAEVVEGFVAEGGTYRQAAVEPPPISGAALQSVRLTGEEALSADAYVFACGPWLPKLFPDVIGKRIEPTRQEVFYFGTPAGDARFLEEKLPIWVETPRFFYGIPGNERRGFKIADDARGPAFDPTSGERVASPEGLASARAYLAVRFPDLARAPLLESRVCQYENTPDHHFIVDRHPGARNLWLVGGGSGHGFKHGPAVGEHVAGVVLETAKPEPLFSLSRFERSGSGAGAPS